MKATHDAAAPPTVYRALDFLLEHGFIHKLASINAFVGCHHPGGAAHAVPFLICDSCQSATELEDDAHRRRRSMPRARALGFAPQAQTLEVHGLCAALSFPRRREPRLTPAGSPAFAGMTTTQKNVRTPNANPRPGNGATSLRNEVCARASSSSRFVPSRNTSNAFACFVSTCHARCASTSV